MAKITSVKISVSLIIALFIGGFLYQAIGPAYAEEVSPDEEAATELFEMAKEYNRAQNPQMARDIFQSLIQQYPNTAKAGHAKFHVAKLDVLIAIKSGDPNTALAGTNKILTDFAGHPALTNVLCGIGKAYLDAGDYQQAKNLYGQVFEDFPNDQLADKARLRFDGADIMLHIDSNDIAAADAATEQLTEDFSEPPVAYVLYCVAGKYSQAGQLQRSEAVYDMVINAQTSPAGAAEVCSFIGGYHRRQGSYARSIQYYEKLIDSYPASELVPHALFMVGRNYESLAEAGGISQSEANSAITSAYEQLVAEYPDSKPAVAAQRWLNKNNAN